MKAKNNTLIKRELITCHSRTKYSLLIMVLIGWLIACVPLSVQADGKNAEITIKGNLLPPTCALSVNGKYGGADGYDVTMPQVYASQLKNSKYVESSALDLVFELSHCSPGQSPTLYIWSSNFVTQDPELFMPVNNTTKGVGIRLRDLGNQQFVKVEPSNKPFQVPLPSAEDGTTRTFRAYVGGLGDKNNPVTCKTESNEPNVLCGGEAQVTIHFEFSYEHLK
ncbi:type 1 fimbrial protein [Photorhabdus noenieputensis]|uniref:fimbrial protein n=1 Tax=Photorhabdus noenieputensis TaxID=1208607 RepID=UPI001BD3F728|nr:fimbrial protein [Photorhabdus noenieputensis]MBS9438310.1 type 1 fimbrial protein [Photorhabdus noenieputensis]MCK3669830.1 type 1 fimbrial protein [Photorhabdus noenieputensis]